MMTKPGWVFWPRARTFAVHSAKLQSRSAPDDRIASRFGRLRLGTVGGVHDLEAQKRGLKNMKFNFSQKQTSRREMLRVSATLAGSAFLAHPFPGTLLRAYAQRAPSAADLVASMRAKFNAAPMETQKLADNVTMLSGPGGSVTVLNGPDGKFVVDTFVAPAWPRLKEGLDGLGSAPLKYVIDTHWHFDHTDNNAPLHAAGATVLAHENTKKRMSEPHDLPVLYRGPDGTLAGLHLDRSPAEALPQQTFAASYKLQANGETLALQHVAPAHTDTDIYVHFQKAGNYTKIVPGHGPLGNKADLAKFRDMLITSRERVQKLKSAGKSVQEAVAEKPFADLDPVWGNGILNGDQWVHVVYLML